MDELQVAAARWGQVEERRSRPKTRWWQHARVVRHVNRLICGRPVDGVAGGDVALLRDRLHSVGAAVSVGCGEGQKEMALLAAGVVERFDLYELSAARVEGGREIAARRGLADRITWHQAVVDLDGAGSYDLVYWNNALHHMLDVEAALRWSKRVGRHVYLNDFIGPTRMQFPDEMLAIASRVRAALPERLLRRADGSLMSRTLRRPDPGRLAAKDPTECADSGNIVPAIERLFPGTEIVPTGGTVYHLALNDVLANTGDEDTPLLDALLLLDEVCANAGHTHYGAGLLS